MKAAKFEVEVVKMSSLLNQFILLKQKDFEGINNYQSLSHLKFSQ